MSNSVDKLLKKASMVVLIVFVVSVAIKAAHDEYQHRQQLAEAKKEQQEYNQFFAWRGGDKNE